MILVKHPVEKYHSQLTSVSASYLIVEPWIQRCALSTDVDECELGEAMCHDNAACSDVVGGEDSYNCTCNPGFTGDGFSMCVGELTYK